MQVYEAARTYVGTPYRDQGLSERGLDCGGLVLRAGYDAGCVDAVFNDLPRHKRRSGWEHEARLRAQGFERVSPAELCANDVLILEIEGMPQHLAIVGHHPRGRGLSLIHALHRKGVVEHALDARWHARIQEVWRRYE